MTYDTEYVLKLHCINSGVCVVTSRPELATEAEEVMGAFGARSRLVIVTDSGQRYYFNSENLKHLYLSVEEFEYASN